MTSSPSLFTLNLKLAFSLQRSFGNKSPWARIWSHLLCLCIDCNNLKTVSRALVIGGEVYVAGQGRKTADWLKKNSIESMRLRLLLTMCRCNWFKRMSDPKELQSSDHECGTASYPDVSLLMKMCAQRKAGRRQRARRLADLVFKMAARAMADKYAVFKISSALFILRILSKSLPIHVVCMKRKLFSPHTLDSSIIMFTNELHNVY